MIINIAITKVHIISLTSLLVELKVHIKLVVLIIR